MTVKVFPLTNYIIQKDALEAKEEVWKLIEK